MIAEKRRIDVGGWNLGVRIEGPSAQSGQASPWVVVLHGFTGSGETMEGPATALRDRWRVLRIDLVGHGESDSPADVDAYSMGAVCEQLSRVLNALDISSAHWLGYSMGGRAALSMAVNHPDRVDSLVLIGASAGLLDAERRRARVVADEALARRILDGGLEAFVDEWMALPLFASQRRLGARALAEARAQRLRNRPAGLALSLEGMGSGAQPPLHEELSGVAVPACLVVGAEDEKFTAIARDLAAQLPDARIELLRDAGHAAHLENPNEFRRVVRAFLTQVEPRETALDPQIAQPTRIRAEKERKTDMSTVNWKSVLEYEDIRYEQSGDGIAKITINRPEKRNAFRPETVKELIDAFTRVREDPALGVVLFTGEGPLAFCSGGDQSVRGDAGYVGDDDGVARLNVLDLQRLIRTLPKPVIALVAGYAIGGGHVLHVICDMTIAAENARFGQTGAKVGSFDGGFGSSHLARLVGQKKAREIWYLCRQYDAQKALQMGLVNEVVPIEELEATGVEWARDILRHSPLAIRCLKSAFNAELDGQAGIQELAGNATLLFYMSEEAREGRDAYNAKREPDFSRFPWRP